MNEQRQTSFASRCAWNKSTTAVCVSLSLCSFSVCVMNVLFWICCLRHAHLVLTLAHKRFHVFSIIYIHINVIFFCFFVLIYGVKKMYTRHSAVDSRSGRLFIIIRGFSPPIWFDFSLHSVCVCICVCVVLFPSNFLFELISKWTANCTTWWSKKHK